MSDRLTSNERRTVYMFGHPYHWARDADGDLKLHPGVAPGETELTMGDLSAMAHKETPDE